MKLAIVADWLPTVGGAEQVIAEFCRLWPDAPLYTTVAKHGRLGSIDHSDIHVSRLQPWYRLLGDHKLLLPWMAPAMEQIDLRGYDVVLSSSHAVGKGIVPPPTAAHVCYCHTPVRYAWEMEDQYLDDFHVPRLLRAHIKKQLMKLRRWDLTTAKRVDMFLANSSTTQERIKRIYGRESTVVTPPVGERFFDVNLKKERETKSERQAEYFLAIGRLVPYKRFDLLIETANALQLPLKIAGTGQDEAHLRDLAGPTVEMLGHVHDDDLPRLYAEAEALLFPQVEDAGVVPLEAQACGTPVIALGQGGILDTVEEGKTGVFFDEQTVASLKAALEHFAQIGFDSAVTREHARQFSAENFRARISQLVSEARDSSTSLCCLPPVEIHSRKASGV